MNKIHEFLKDILPKSDDYRFPLDSDDFFDEMIAKLINNRHLWMDVSLEDSSSLSHAVKVLLSVINHRPDLNAAVVGIIMLFDKDEGGRSLFANTLLNLATYNTVTTDISDVKLFNPFSSQHEPYFHKKFSKIIENYGFEDHPEFNRIKSLTEESDNEGWHIVYPHLWGAAFREFELYAMSTQLFNQALPGQTEALIENSSKLIGADKDAILCELFVKANNACANAKPVKTAERCEIDNDSGLVRHSLWIRHKVDYLFSLLDMINKDLEKKPKLLKAVNNDCDNMDFPLGLGESFEAQVSLMFGSLLKNSKGILGSKGLCENLEYYFDGLYQRGIGILEDDPGYRLNMINYIFISEFGEYKLEMKSFIEHYSFKRQSPVFQDLESKCSPEDNSDNALSGFSI